MKGWKPQKPTKLDGNDTTTLSHHPYILCRFATACTNMICGAWRVSYVVGSCNVVAILSMADCLDCMQKLCSA